MRSAIVRHARLIGASVPAAALTDGRAGDACAVGLRRSRDVARLHGTAEVRGERREIDAGLACHPPRERRCGRAGLLDIDCRGAARRNLGRGSGRRIRQTRRRSGRRLPDRENQRDHGPDRDVVAARSGDPGERAVGGRLDLDGDLVGLDLDQRFALADVSPRRLSQRITRAGVLGHTERPA